MVWEGYRKGSGYVAVGVSEDSKMGKDIMFICSQSGVKEYTSAGKSAPTPSSENQLNTITTTNIGGDMYCKFESGTLLKSKGIDFSADLKNEKYHILVAVGDGELSYHAQNKIGSGEPSALGLVQAQGSSSKVLLKVHGLAMIAAWVGCAGTGMMIARYFKNTWKGTKVMGTDVWFTAHRSLMMSAVLFTAIGLILVMIHNKGWNYTAESIRNNPHPALGLATVILAFMQPVMAVFRPHPGTKFRPIFNWGHTIVGNAAFSIGIAAIFLSGDLPAIRIEYKGYVACLIVYIIVYTLVQLFLAFHNLMMERSEAKTEVHPMAEKGGELEDIPVENKDKPGSKIRQIVLLLFILFSLAVSISLIVAIFKFD
ncbi:putative ferric-chelate reductase 1 homolog [Eurytemora carolleeae]|uniref:putative ferric-chelate reductase 1 homolog n=1 Tax=Eurytemora carolleeae TaxID=1294199 RepID=UPI000C78D651|nr:putative ferric-chelate reductase 1 homolog [Eurytemora carolleeae]|eukprot:XP_023326976.1 putative ferric-chelate reductase 1 homolog [Eurytemora affinis]